MPFSEPSQASTESPRTRWYGQSLPDNIMNELLHDYYMSGPSLTIGQIREKYSLEINQTLPGCLGAYRHAERCPLCYGEILSTFANRATSLKNTKSEGYLHRRKTVRTDISKRIMRSDENYKITLPKCTDCGHIDDRDCRCIRCTKQMEYNRQLAIERYAEHYESEFCEPRIGELDAEQVLLLAWFRAGENRSRYAQGSTCRDVALSACPPDTQFMVMSNGEALERLQDQGLLRLDLDSLDMAVEMTSIDEHVLHKGKLHFIQPFDDGSIDKKLSAQGRSLFLDSVSRDDVLRIMTNLCLQECLHFYSQLSRNRNLPFKFSNDFASTIKKSIIDIGLYKTASCIEWAIHNISKDNVDHNIPSYIVANTIKSNLTNYWFNQEKEKKYPIKPLLRNETTFREPEIVSVFIDHFLPVTVDYGESIRSISLYQPSLANDVNDLKHID